MNWKALGFGILLAVVLYFMFLSFRLGYLSILSFIIAPFIGGYITGGNVKIGAIHGAIISFSGSIISILLLVILVSTFSTQQIILGNNILFLVIAIIIYTIIGAGFGIIGVLAKNRALKQ